MMDLLPAWGGERRRPNRFDRLIGCSRLLSVRIRSSWNSLFPLLSEMVAEAYASRWSAQAGAVGARG